MNIDDKIANTIREVERLYQSVTGSDVPPEGETAFAAIPPEVDPQRYVEAQVERLTQMLGSDVNGAPRPLTTFAPPLSVFDNERERVYRLDVPGVQRKDIEVSLVNGVLLVKGRRGEAHGLRMTRVRMPRLDADVLEVHLSRPGGGLALRVTHDLEDALLLRMKIVRRRRAVALVLGEKLLAEDGLIAGVDDHCQVVGLALVDEVQQHLGEDEGGLRRLAARPGQDADPREEGP